MRSLLVVLASAVLLVGCGLSKDESTLARLHDEMQNKKKVRPKGFLTEEQVGVKYYPDADYVNSREYEEGGAHIWEVGLNTNDPMDKVRDFYEKQIGTKGMPMMANIYSIQRDYGGKHYEIDYGRFDRDTTITIKVSKPTG